MTIRVLKPGLQSTLQSQPRRGQRHLGVPTSGPADPLSMALANRLVGNVALTTALEVTLTGVTLEFGEAAIVAITGATAQCTLNASVVHQHQSMPVRPGDRLKIGPAEVGMRSYLAVAGGFVADELLGSCSTYLPAGIGGHEGRALLAGDELKLVGTRQMPFVETPSAFRLPMLRMWTARATQSLETLKLRDPSQLFDRKFSIASRSDRMGILLDGDALEIDADRQMPSGPLFPGIIQCPPDGSLYVMSVDSGTTGGYPRVAKVARSDLHILGQLRPGDSLTLVERNYDDAARELQQKHDYWREWLPDIADVI